MLRIYVFGGILLFFIFCLYFFFNFVAFTFAYGALGYFGACCTASACVSAGHFIYSGSHVAHVVLSMLSSLKDIGAEVWGTWVILHHAGFELKS